MTRWNLFFGGLEIDNHKAARLYIVFPHSGTRLIAFNYLSQLSLLQLLAAVFSPTYLFILWAVESFVHYFRWGRNPLTGFVNFPINGFFPSPSLSHPPPPLHLSHCFRLSVRFHTFQVAQGFFASSAILSERCSAAWRARVRAYFLRRGMQGGDKKKKVIWGHGCWWRKATLISKMAAGMHLVRPSRNFFNNVLETWICGPHKIDQ